MGAAYDERREGRPCERYIGCPGRSDGRPVVALLATRGDRCRKATRRVASLALDATCANVGDHGDRPASRSGSSALAVPSAGNNGCVRAGQVHVGVRPEGIVKAVDELTPSDFAVHPVWEFVNDGEANLPHEAFVRPAHIIPVSSGDSRLLGTELTLADGRRVNGFLGNVDLQEPVSTEHFSTVTVFDDCGNRFDLARYHDVDFESRGPAALARFLKSNVESVFPMTYDISTIAVGEPESIRRTIRAVPDSRLSRDELIQLARGNPGEPAHAPRGCGSARGMMVG